MDEVGRDFDDFVTASSPSLLRTAYLLTGDHGHAEDALQHALMATARLAALLPDLCGQSGCRVQVDGGVLHPAAQGGDQFFISGHR